MRLLIEAIMMLFIGAMAAHILIIEDDLYEYKFYWHECLEELEELEEFQKGGISPPFVP